MIQARPTVLVATGNRGKLSELSELLDDDVTITSLADVSLSMPEESGTTFAENALLKARHGFSATGLIAIADDSGLEVDALGGRPGVRSARFAGEDASDDQNRSKLLAALDPSIVGARSARFVCAIAIVSPLGEHTMLGSVEGTIATDERGTSGFGYDPLFELPDGRTMAELTSTEKSRISHRGRAMEAAIPVLREHIAHQHVHGPAAGTPR